ncbi:Uncharacterised protein [uncultured archaeon]|nr:Uncharacterised protein [uncultured archaeon]
MDYLALFKAGKLNIDSIIESVMNFPSSQDEIKKQVESRFGKGSWKDISDLAKSLATAVFNAKPNQLSKETNRSPPLNTLEWQRIQDDQRKKQEAENNHQKYDYGPKPPNEWTD